MTPSETPVRSPLRVLIVDDQPIVREMLVTVVKRLDPAAVTIEFDGLEAAEQCLGAEPGCALVITESEAPGTAGRPAVPELIARDPGLSILVLSARDDPDTARACLDAGARGFISKRSPTRVIAEAIRLVLVGGTYVPPEALRGAGARPERVEGAAISAAEGARLGLTPRQLDVLALLIQGEPNKVICRRLNLAEGTVKTHTAAIYRALNVNNRTQAVYAASRLAIASKPDGTGNLQPGPAPQSSAKPEYAPVARPAPRPNPLFEMLRGRTAAQWA